MSTFPLPVDAPEAVRRALSPVDVRQLLETQANNGTRIESVRARYIRYKKLHGTVVAYEVETNRGTVWAYTRAAEPERLRQEAARFAAPAANSAGLPPLVLAADASLLLLCFPNDRYLGEVESALDLRKLRRVLIQHESRYEALRLRKRKSHMQVVRYKPERRAVLRASLSWADEHEKKFSEELFVRCSAVGFSPDRSAALHAANAAGLCVPRVVAQPTARVSVESSVGPSLPNVDLARVGAELARLHSIAWQGTHDAATAYLESAPVEIRALAQLAPHLGKRAQELLCALGPCPSRERTLVHGDFHVQQIVPRGDERPAVVDFDRAGTGFPAQDLGWFYAHLALANQPGWEARMYELERGYATLRALPSALELQWHKRWSLLATVTQPFRRVQYDWPAALERQLDRVEEREVHA